ncbi:hypothetical protein V8C37DRAFT_389234 [Trichoderma ceciliae]
MEPEILSRLVGLYGFETLLPTDRMLHQHQRQNQHQHRLFCWLELVHQIAHITTVRRCPPSLTRRIVEQSVCKSGSVIGVALLSCMPLVTFPIRLAH